MLVHILSALHPQSGVPIRQLLRKLQSSPEFKSQGACIIIIIMRPDIVHDTWQHMVSTEFYSWDTSFGHVNPSLMYPCGQVVFCFNLGTFFERFLQLGWDRVHLNSN